MHHMRARRIGARKSHLKRLVAVSKKAFLKVLHFYFFSKILCIIPLQKKSFLETAASLFKCDFRACYASHADVMHIFWLLLIRKIVWWQLEHLIVYELVFIEANEWKYHSYHNDTWMSLADSSKSEGFWAYSSSSWASINFLSTFWHAKNVFESFC